MRIRLILLLVCAGLPAAPITAQVPGGGAEESADSVTVVPGAEYAAGALHRTLFGRSWRRVWTTPIRVPVLSLDTEAGGLTPVRGGGDRQTRSLRMAGADGREYVFRSVHKDYPFLPADLREAYAGRVLLDQLKSEFPTGALAVPRLLDAVGVLHATPRLFVMPDDPRLGEHRAVYARMLGMLEERPNEGAGGRRGFAGARRVVGTEKLLEELEDGGGAAVAAREYLDARLVDLLVGDWDRHDDQWRWVLDETGAAPRWRPVPRDRDKTFSRYDGVLLGMARSHYPRATVFGPRFRDLHGLAYGGRGLDHRLLAGLDRAEWEAAVARVRAALTDEVIHSAVAALPPEHQALEGAALVRALRARRDDLARPAAWLYRSLAAQADVHATDLADAAEVVHQTDGSVSVRLFAPGVEGAAARWYERTFVPGETREVRLYLHGGDDRVRVAGRRVRVPVRVIGGGGDDRFDAAPDVAGGLRLYDHRGRNVVGDGTRAALDVRTYERPSTPAPLVGEGYRDWGGWNVPLTWVGYRPEVGAFAGGGRVWYRNGFRREPWASRTSLRAAVAPSDWRLGAELDHVRRVPHSGVAVGVFARASELEVTRFHGFGNDAEAEGPGSRYAVLQRQLVLAPSIVVPVARRAELSLGALVRHSDTRDEEGTLLGELRPVGTGSFGEAGARAGAAWSAADSAGVRRVRVAAGVAGFPAAWDVDEAYGEASADARIRLGTTLPLRPALVLRGGAARAWGGYPYHAAAAIGGAESLRGFAERRFAGDAALSGTAELHLRLSRFAFIFPGSVGVMAVADAGRVYLGGDSPGGWHTAAGGGVWFQFMGRGPVLSATAVHGERTRVYVGLTTEP